MMSTTPPSPSIELVPPGSGASLTSRTAPLLAALGGALAGVGVGLIALSALRLPYQPYDSTVGPPAYLDFSTRKKLWGYLLLSLLPLAGGWIASGMAGVWTRWAERRRAGALPVWGAWFAPVALLVMGLLALVAGAARLPGEFLLFLDAPLRSPGLWLQVAAGALAGLVLAIPSRSALNSPDREAAALANPVYLWIGWALLSLHLWILLMPAMASNLWPSLLAPAVAAILIASHREGGRAWEAEPARGFWSWIELGAWGWLAAFPLSALWLRFGRSFSLPSETPRSYLILAALGPALALSTALVRRARGQRRLASYALCLPFTAMTLYAGAAYPASAYDAYHQAEYIYPWRAMSQGLKPFKDIFFVHGLGFNTIAGWAVGDRVKDVPCIDIVFLNLISAAGIALAAWLLLRALGPRWRLLAVGVAAIGAGAASTKGGRYAAFYLVALAAGRFAATGGAGWMAVAGALSWIAALYSLDIGAISLMTCGVWTLALAIRPVGEAEGNRLLARRLAPLGAFLLGVIAAVIPTLLVFWWLGVLEDFFSLHLAYAKVKQHYDSLPFPPTGIAGFIAPAMTALAAGALISARRSANPPPKALRALTLFLAIANFLAFLRSLDRSDEGHIVYGSALAWPLLACVIALRGAGDSPIRALARSALVVATLGTIPWASTAIRGGISPTIDPIFMGRLYAEDCRKAFALPMSAGVASDPIFTYTEELKTRLKPGDSLLDLTNRPGIYPWGDVRCPTRFYANYYASSREWQEEVIDALERDKTKWILFPGKGHGGQSIDGIPEELRQWDLARYVWRNYDVDFPLRDNAILLARGPITHALDAKMQARLMTEHDLGKAPLVWGRSAEGAPRVPPQTIWESPWVEPTEKLLYFPPGVIPLLGAASEMQVEFEKGWSGTMRVRSVTKQDAAQFKASFEADAGFAGPYRIPVASFAGWAWATDRAALRFGWMAEASTASPRPRFRLRFLR